MSTPRQVLVVAAVCLLAVPAAAAGTEVHGEWWTPGFAARVRIEDCAGALCGRIVWLWDEAARAADGRPLVGRQVIDAMRADAPARWSGGQLHNPEDGRSYSGTLLLEAPHRLVVRGCIAFLCRSQVWRRFDAARSPPVGQITSLNTAEAAPLRGFGSRSRLRAASANAGSPFLFGGHARQQLGAELH